MFQENKARQIFRKTNISYPLIRTPSYCMEAKYDSITFEFLLYASFFSVGFRGVAKIPQTSKTKMKHFARIVNGWKLLTSIAKLFILDVCCGSSLISTSLMHHVHFSKMFIKGFSKNSRYYIKVSESHLLRIFISRIYF